MTPILFIVCYSLFVALVFAVLLTPAREEFIKSPPLVPTLFQTHQLTRPLPTHRRLDYSGRVRPSRKHPDFTNNDCV